MVFESEAPTFADRMIDSGIGGLKFFHDYISGSSIKESIKMLRWWCKCQSSKNQRRELPHEEFVTAAETVMEEKLESAKNFVENFTDSFELPEMDIVMDEPTHSTFASSLMKFGIMLLFAVCVFYVLSEIIRKMPKNRTTTPATTDSQKLTSSNLQISKLKSFQEGEIFFKQQELKNSLTVLTPILTQQTKPLTPVNSKELPKLYSVSKEKLLRKAASPPKAADDDTAATAILKLERTQSSSSPGNTDRTQVASSPTRTDPTQGASSPARTDATQKSSRSGVSPFNAKL